MHFIGIFTLPSLPPPAAFPSPSLEHPGVNSLFLVEVSHFLRLCQGSLERRHV